MLIDSHPLPPGSSENGAEGVVFRGNCAQSVAKVASDHVACDSAWFVKKAPETLVWTKGSNLS